MDTTSLEHAYRRLLEVARPGRPRAPADARAWSAEQVLAHVVATDRLLAAATADLLDGGRPRYDNRVTGNEAYLTEIARAAGGWDGLVGTVRQSGLEVVLLARRLDDRQMAAPVPTRIQDGDTVRVDAVLPWAGVLNTHAEVHLPAHQSDLEALGR